MHGLIVQAITLPGSCDNPLHVFAGRLSFPGNPTATPRIDQREANQERRIQQGVQSGQLTPRETARLQAEQGQIQKAEARARADGKVTPRERERIEHMQGRASRDIRRDKHDGQRDMNHDGRRDRSVPPRQPAQMHR